VRERRWWEDSSLTPEAVAEAAAEVEAREAEADAEDDGAEEAAQAAGADEMIATEPEAQKTEA
jgi:hypothetical protein